MKELKGKVAAITGAASGLGRSMALAFAAEGMDVALADVDEEGLLQTQNALGRYGVRTTTLRVDVSNAAQVEAFAERTVKELSAIHLVCNNAGVSPLGAVWENTVADWQWILGVNLWGVIHGVETFVPRMIAGGQGGHIVNTASMAGLIASQGLGVYNTSKYAVVGLSETLAKDLKPYGIGVSVLCPMGVETRIRESERSRPAALRNEPGTAGAAVELIGRYLAPDTVAGMVLDAIRRGELYVITHDEGLEPLRRRFDRMQQSILSRRKA